jgi:hypothetical protein
VTGRYRAILTAAVAATCTASGWFLVRWARGAAVSSAQSDARAVPSTARPNGKNPPVPVPSPAVSAASQDTSDESGARHEVVNDAYHPRAPGEWQGMLVSLTRQATCETSDRCGLAMACRQGRCGACVWDHDCTQGEVCVLDHCVLEYLAECRTRRDCSNGEYCVLSGYSVGVRGNARMRAYCLSTDGPSAASEEDPSPAPAVSGDKRGGTSTAERLMDRVTQMTGAPEDGQ